LIFDFKAICSFSLFSVVHKQKSTYSASPWCDRRREKFHFQDVQKALAICR
jgi:hypothetical protein